MQQVAGAGAPQMSQRQFDFDLWHSGASINQPATAHFQGRCHTSTTHRHNPRPTQELGSTHWEMSVIWQMTGVPPKSSLWTSKQLKMCPKVCHKMYGWPAYNKYCNLIYILCSPFWNGFRSLSIAVANPIDIFFKYQYLTRILIQKPFLCVVKLIIYLNKNYKEFKISRK